MGCLSVVPSVPSRGGSQWQRLEGPHFIVLTNQEDGEALATLNELERFLAIFGQFGWTGGTAHPHKVTAVVFENDVELHAFVPHRVGGMFFSSAPYAPLILAYNGEGGFRSLAIRHELVHYLASLSTPRQPAWFAEGIACYFATASTNIDNDEVSLGRPDEQLAQTLEQHGVLSAVQLLDPHRDAHGRTFYPSAWLLVHYLMTHHQQAFVDYHARLIAAEEPSEAWQAAFPTLTPERLDLELEQYLMRGRYQYAVRDLPVDDGPPPLRRRLTDADVLALRALLFALNPLERRTREDAHDLMLRDLLAAEQLSPLHPLGTVVRLREVVHAPREAVALSRELVRAHPEEWTAWVVLIESLHRDAADAPTIDAAASGAVHFHPDNVTLLLAATDAALAVADHQRALSYARRAKQTYGSHPEVLLRYAFALFGVGACDTARAAGVRALSRLPMTADGEERVVVQLHAEDTRCRERTSR